VDRIPDDSIIPSLGSGRTGIPSGLSTNFAFPRCIAARRRRSHRDLSRGDHLEYGRERWFRRANCACFLASTTNRCTASNVLVAWTSILRSADGTPAHQTQPGTAGGTKRRINRGSGLVESVCSWPSDHVMSKNSILIENAGHRQNGRIG
jgi:hypothetical protein